MGNVDDWENGVRGWIIWVVLVLLFVDVFVKFGWFIWWEVVFFSDDIVIMYGENEDEINIGYDYLLLMIGRRWLIFYFLVLVIICVVSVYVIFGFVVLWYYIGLVFILVFFIVVVGIRFIVEIDYNFECVLGMFFNEYVLVKCLYLLVLYFVFGIFLFFLNFNVIFIDFFFVVVL